MVLLKWGLDKSLPGTPVLCDNSNVTGYLLVTLLAMGLIKSCSLSQTRTLGLDLVGTVHLENLHLKWTLYGVKVDASVTVFLLNPGIRGIL